MNICIGIKGSIDCTREIKLSIDLDSDEKNEVCIEIIAEEIGIYIDFNELKAAIESISILKQLQSQ